ncbi:MAG: monovalent cation/H(+) antiporter subunit G [Bacillota bacterium]|jgi:monovalent cation/proton antiporter, MnhG/PhaG subunit|nr:Na+/H+ antiporter subunit G [Bacillota bacterium]
MTSFIVSFFLTLGMLLSIVTAVGLHRLKDPYSRLHATSAINSFGLICILLASVFYFWGHSTVNSVRQLLTVFFIFVTVPAGTHILSRAAIVRGVKVWKPDGRDLAPHEQEIVQTIKKQSDDRRAQRLRQMDAE